MVDKLYLSVNIIYIAKKNAAFGFAGSDLQWM